jgi:hypothetical protein
MTFTSLIVVDLVMVSRRSFVSCRRVDRRTLILLAYVTGFRELESTFLALAPRRRTMISVVDHSVFLLHIELDTFWRCVKHYLLRLHSLHTGMSCMNLASNPSS